MQAQCWHQDDGLCSKVKVSCSHFAWCVWVQADKEAREDRAQRDPDYDSHLGIERDPVTREITHVAAST